MYKPKHFELHELVPKDLFNKYAFKQHILWGLFDERLLRIADTVREEFGSMTINNWYWQGPRQYSGFRPPDCTIGATLSQHRFGRALDMIPKTSDVDDIRQDMIESQNDIAWKDIGGIEMDITWLHVDTRMRDAEGNINLFYP